MKKGKQTRIPTPGQQKWHHVIGAYNWRTGEVIYTTVTKKNSKTFTHFLEQLVTSVPVERPIVYVLDNASYHRSHVSQAMIAYFEDRAIPVWLPKYCSDLNPIERFWRYMKEQACANRLHETIEDVVQRVTHVLETQNDLESADRFCFQGT